MSAPFRFFIHFLSVLNSSFYRRAKIFCYLFYTFILLYAFFWVISRRLNFICRRFGTLCLFHLRGQVGTYLPMKIEQTECSKTSAYKIQTPANYPEESIQHSEHGGSLKSRIFVLFNPTHVLILSASLSIALSCIRVSDTDTTYL